jgi:hypothetical protein
MLSGGENPMPNNLPLAMLIALEMAEVAEFGSRSFRS